MDNCLCVKNQDLAFRGDLIVVKRNDGTGGNVVVEGTIAGGMSVYTLTKRVESPTLTLDDNTAVYLYAVTGDTLFTFDPSQLTRRSGTAITFELYLEFPAGLAPTITFPAGVSWLNNEVPSMSTPGLTYMLVFRSLDGGLTWLGSKEGAY